MIEAGYDTAVDRDVNMVSGIVVNADTVKPDLRGGLKATIIEGVTDHLPCRERRHLAAIGTCEHLLCEVDAVVNVIILGCALNHRPHRIRTLRHKLLRARFAVFFESVLETVPVRIASLTHVSTLRFGQCDFVVMESQHFFCTIHHHFDLPSFRLMQHLQHAESTPQIKNARYEVTLLAFVICAFAVCSTWLVMTRSCKHAGAENSSKDIQG